MGGGGALTAIRAGHAMAHRATPAQRRVWCHAATVASRAPQQLSPGSPEPSRAGRIGRVTSGAQRRGARPRHSVRAGCEPAASALRVPSVMKRGRYIQNTAGFMFLIKTHNDNHTVLSDLIDARRSRAAAPLLPLGLGTFSCPFSGAGDGKSLLVPTLAAPRPRTCSRRRTPPNDARAPTGASAFNTRRALAARAP